MLRVLSTTRLSRRYVLVTSCTESSSSLGVGGARAHLPVPTHPIGPTSCPGSTEHLHITKDVGQSCQPFGQ